MTYHTDVFRAASAVGFDDEHDLEVARLKEIIHRQRAVIQDALVLVELGDLDDARRLLREALKHPPKKERGGA